MRIPPDHLMSEAVIQAAFFHYCQIIGLNCTLELTSPTGRHDLVVFDDSWLLAKAIVECKKSDGFRQRQIERYKLTGLPVYKLFCIHGAEAMVKQISASSFAGAEWKLIMAMPRKEWRKRRPKHRFSPLDLCEEVNFRAD